MATEATYIAASDHARKAWELLAESDRKFGERKHLPASTALWESTVQAVMAVAVHRGWTCDGTRLFLRKTVERLAEDEGDNLISLNYVYAEDFRDNAQLDFMEFRELAFDGAKARNFIRYLLTMIY